MVGPDRVNVWKGVLNFSHKKGQKQTFKINEVSKDNEAIEEAIFKNTPFEVYTIVQILTLENPEKY